MRQGSGPTFKAFSLVELLVVIAVLAILVGLLVPALGRARLAAQRVVSAANLGSLARVHAGYAADNKGAFVNPFDAGTPERYPTLVTWYPQPSPASFSTMVLPKSLQSPGEPRAMTMKAGGRTTEPFSHLWSCFVSYYLHDADRGLSCFRDPADPVLSHKVAELIAANLGEDFDVFETSYRYPPVFWLKPDRYASENFQPVGEAETESRWLAHNRQDDATMPGLKVLLFERFDTSLKSRRSSIAGTGSVPLPPQWNNFAASPQVAYVDCSVSKTKMSDVHALGESPDPNVAAQFRPSGRYDPPAEYAYTWLIGPPIGPSSGTDPYETGSEPFPATTGWRAYFYATRGGVRGIDVQRR